VPAKSRASAANALDELYAAGPEDFVAERNRLERELRAEGLEEADELARLKKPPMPVFVVNQLARVRGSDVGELLESAEKLIRGLESGDAQEVATRQGELAERVHRLASKAEATTGRPLSEAVHQRVVALLRLAALDRANAPRLRRGTLAEELEPTGFEALAGLQLARRAKPAKSPKRQETAGKRTAAEDKRAARLEQLERELADARAELREAEATMRQAEKAADSARRIVERLAKRVERAQGA